MLNQIDLFIKSCNLDSLQSELGIKLQGYIMAQLDSGYAGYLHTLSANPYALYAFKSVDGIIARISSLSSDADCILKLFEGKKKLIIYGLNEPLEILSVKKAKSIEPLKLYQSLKGDRFTMHFLSPCTYRKNGKYICLPPLEKLFRSAAEKFNKFSKSEYLIDDIEELISCIDIIKYDLHSARYSVGGSYIPSMIGQMKIKISAPNEKAKALKNLLGYATYSGIGAKTSMGMGGFYITDK